MRPIRLSTFQKALWAVASIALIGFVWLQISSSTDPQVENPAFRADFELTDHRGMIQTEADFAGQWMLVFFGFANCPDICPTTLAEVAAVMDALGPDANKV